MEQRFGLGFSGRLHAPIMAVSVQRFCSGEHAGAVADCLHRLHQEGMRPEHLALLLETMVRTRQRQAQQAGLVDLVWTGPETPAVTNLDIGVVGRELSGSNGMALSQSRAPIGPPRPGSCIMTCLPQNESGRWNQPRRGHNRRNGRGRSPLFLNPWRREHHARRPLGALIDPRAKQRDFVGVQRGESLPFRAALGGISDSGAFPDT
jgi:hypothetical protein